MVLVVEAVLAAGALMVIRRQKNAVFSFRDCCLCRVISIFANDDDEKTTMQGRVLKRGLAIGAGAFRLLLF